MQMLPRAISIMNSPAIKFVFPLPRQQREKKFTHEGRKRCPCLGANTLQALPLVQPAEVSQCQEIFGRKYYFF